MFAGIGTLILFTVVQLSMILIAIFYKEKLTVNKIVGISLAFVGLVYLLYPKEDFSISLTICSKKSFLIDLCTKI